MRRGKRTGRAKALRGQCVRGDESDDRGSAGDAHHGSLRDESGAMIDREKDVDGPGRDGQRRDHRPEERARALGGACGDDHDHRGADHFCGQRREAQLLHARG